jgi:hypothetical protein
VNTFCMVEKYMFFNGCCSSMWDPQRLVVMLWYPLKFSWTIICINVEQKTDVLETNSVSTIGVDVVNDHKSLIYVYHSFVRVCMSVFGLGRGRVRACTHLRSIRANVCITISSLQPLCFWRTTDIILYIIIPVYHVISLALILLRGTDVHTTNTQSIIYQLLVVIDSNGGDRVCHWCDRLPERSLCIS